MLMLMLMMHGCVRVTPECLISCQANLSLPACGGAMNHEQRAIPMHLGTALLYQITVTELRTDFDYLRDRPTKHRYGIITSPAVHVYTS